MTIVPTPDGPVQIATAVAGTGHRRTAEQRRAQVLEAAIHEFAVYGLHGATTAAIAARANISQPYLFALFGDKKALFLAAQDRAGGDIRTALTQACRAATPGESPAIALQRYRRLLTCPDSLRCQLQGYAAAADPQIREHMRRGHLQITDLARRLSGAPESSANRLIAISVLITVSEVLELPSLNS